MQSALATKQHELTILAATLAVCRTLDGNKAIGEFLLAQCQKHPTLIFNLLGGFQDYGFKADAARSHFAAAKAAVAAHPDLQLDRMTNLLATFAKRELAGDAAAKAWALFLVGLSAEQRDAANCVLNNGFKCAITVELLHKVAAKLEQTAPPETTGIYAPVVEVTVEDVRAAHGSARGLLLVNGQRAANIVWVLGPAMKQAIAVLRAVGITVK